MQTQMKRKNKLQDTRVNGSSNNNKKATCCHTNSDPALYVMLKGASILHKNYFTVDLIASETLSPHTFPTSD